MNMQIFPVANIVVCGYEFWAFAQIFSCLLDFIYFTILSSFQAKSKQNTEQSRQKKRKKEWH